MPVGQQADLTPVDLGGVMPIDPATEDFFRRVIERRQLTKKDEALPEAERQWRSAFLKILANSGSYGVVIQMDRERTGRMRPATVYGVEGHSERRLTARKHRVRIAVPPWAR